jgi:hypothetical protein
MNISLDALSVLLRQNNVDSETAVTIMKQAEDLIKLEQGEKGERKKNKNEFIIVALTDKTEITDIPCFIVQVDQNYDHNLLPEQIDTIAVRYNENRKKKPACKNVIDVFEIVQNKFFKEFKIARKTKHPVIVTIKSNQIQ